MSFHIRQPNESGGFTLVETMVAISLLTIAIVAPMSLTTQSLASAFYARDQITAFHLAQEAIESVRHARDRNVLKNALGTLGTLGTRVDLLQDIPQNVDFIVDTTNGDQMTACSGSCAFLLRDSDGLYGYQSGTATSFKRIVHAQFLDNGINSTDEIRLTVTVSWQTGSFYSQHFTIYENLYRWVNDDTGIQ